MQKKTSVGNQLRLPIDVQTETETRFDSSCERPNNVIYFSEIKQSSSCLDEAKVLKTIQLFAKTLDW